MTDIKDRYLQWLQLKGLSKRTQKEYTRYFKTFDVSQINPNYVAAYVIKNNNTVARAFINSLLEFISGSNLPDDFKLIASKVKLPKVTGRKKRKIPDFISKSEAHKLAQSMNNKRNGIMALLTFYGGLRVSELLGYEYDEGADGIKPNDFNWTTWVAKPKENGKLKVLGKGKKQRIVFVPAFLMRIIYQWIRQEVSQKQEKSEPLFLIGGSRWQKILYTASEHSLGRRIHPHTLRHGCATWLYEEGWDLKEVQEYLGHESIVTTQIYAHVSKKNLSQKFKNIT